MASDATQFGSACHNRLHMIKGSYIICSFVKVRASTIGVSLSSPPGYDKAFC